MIIKHATETSTGIVKWRKTRFFRVSFLGSQKDNYEKTCFSPFYDPSWCFCRMIYYQTLAHAIRNIFYFDTCVKKSKTTPENAKMSLKSTFFGPLRIFLVNQTCWYAEKMTGQLRRKMLKSTKYRFWLQKVDNFWNGHRIQIHDPRIV